MLDQWAPEHAGNLSFILGQKVFPAQFDEFLDGQLAIAILIDDRERDGRIFGCQAQAFEEQFVFGQRDVSRMVFVDGLRPRTLR